MVEKKQQQGPVVLAAQSRTDGGKTRSYRFPPLRKPWMKSINQQSSAMGMNGDYQQQLMDGFQEGMDKGFEQGVNQGKDEGYQQGKQQGYEEGYQQGIKEGKAAGNSLFNEAARPLDKVAHELQTFLANYEQRRRTELLQLVEKVTHQVIRCELALQPTQLLSLVEEALVGLPTEPVNLKIHLNPEEFARINDVEPDKVTEWGLMPDPEIELGECRIITDTMEMDVGCQHRLEQCIDVLKKNLLPEQIDE